MIVLLAILTLASAGQHHRDHTVNSPPPINLSPIQAERYGDWAVSFVGNGFYAAETTNSDGSVLGAVCDHTGCFSYVNSEIQCDNKAKYPALLNAPGGAFDEILTCATIAKRNFLVLSDEGPVIDAMSIGGIIGVAVPMASGEFRVSPFSLTGAARAYARAAQLAGYSESASGTGDSRM